MPDGENMAAIKYDFVQIFDRPVFTATVENHIYDRFKRKKVDSAGKYLK